PYEVVDSEKHRLLALEAARKSIVLLKNEAKILPLSKSLKKIAVIGSNADDLEVLLGNYNGYPSSPITPLKGIQNKLPNAEVSYAAGCKLADGLPLFESIPGSVLFTDKTLKANGLKASYFANEALEGEPAIERIDKDVNFIWRTESPGTGLNNDVFSVKWTGYLSVPESGSYALGGEAFSGMKLYLNDTLIVSREDVHHPRKEYEYVSLKAGEAYKIDLEYKQKNTDYAIMRLLWEKPDEHLQNEALKIAKEADVVIMCMGLSPLLEGEEMKVKVDGFSGGDREHTDLPLSQISLMKKIKELGKPMVLVLLNGSAVSVNWENENIPAIIEAWYPGQAGGTAIADVLFGDYNPAGRLPLTFYKSINDIPEFSDYDMKGKTYRYFEGKPLYEFGYGLSYSKFAYKNFEIPSQINTDQKIEVSVDVINTGEFDGDEVTQLYVIRKEGHVNNPKKTLVGFQRNYLKKGETKKVKFTINALQLAQVNETLQQVVSAGDIEISVGGMQASEKSLREKAVIKKQVKIIGQDFKIN
ncbi:MAG: glycoside hydrolase family 3 C-terminal domain-containing protein, partial [Flavobacteriaceae bacterium]|nr:glycoside hydrolase family 3 C-terminal domain-containing protein [Flavobacteriaceae bacterium]